MNERRLSDRRRIPRGGRRAADLPSPVLRADIDDQLRELDTAAAIIRTALDVGEMKRAQDAATALQRTADAILELLVPRRAQRRS